MHVILTVQKLTKFSQVQRPPEIKLTLRPQESMGGVDRPAYAQVDLIVRCSCSYPDE